MHLGLFVGLATFWPILLWTDAQQAGTNAAELGAQGLETRDARGRTTGFGVANTVRVALDIRSSVLWNDHVLKQWRLRSVRNL